MWIYLVNVNNMPYTGMCCQGLRILLFCTGVKLVESFTFEAFIYYSSVSGYLLSECEVSENRLDIVGKNSLTVART